MPVILNCLVRTASMLALVFTVCFVSPLVAFAQDADNDAGANAVDRTARRPVSRIVIVREEDDQKTFKLSVVDTQSELIDWNFDIPQGRLQKGLVLKSVAGRGNANSSIRVEANGESADSTAPHIASKTSSTSFEVEFELRNAKQLAPGVYTGSYPFEFTVKSEEEAGAGTTQVKPYPFELQLTIVKQGHRLADLNFLSAAAASSVVQPGVILGREVICDVTLQSWELSEAAPCPVLDFDLDWSADAETAVTKLLTAKVPFTSSGAMDVIRMSLDQEGVALFEPDEKSTAPLEIAADSDAAELPVSKVRALFNSRLFIQPGQPQSWIDPVVKSKLSWEKAIELTDSEFPDIKLYEHLRTIRVRCPALDVRGQLTARVQLEDMTALEASANVGPGVGVFPQIAIAGEEIRIVASGKPGIVLGTVKVGTSSATLQPRSTNSDIHECQVPCPDVGSHQIVVADDPTLTGELLVPLTVLGPPQRPTRPRYLFFGSDSPLVWAPWLRHYIKPKDYQAYPERGWDLVVQDAREFQLSAGSISEVTLVPLGVLKPTQLTEESNVNFQRRFNASLIAKDNVPLLTASARFPNGSRLSAGDEGAGLELSFVSPPDVNGRHTAFDELPQMLHVEVPVALSLVQGDQTYERICYLPFDVEIIDGRPYDYYAFLLAAAASALLITLAVVIYREWQRPPTAVPSSWDESASHDEGPFSKKSPEVFSPNTDHSASHMLALSEDVPPTPVQPSTDVADNIENDGREGHSSSDIKPFENPFG
ncbi:MAG: hypothetical protein R3C18_08390 [Planctomycetaceae bacterium]